MRLPLGSLIRRDPGGGVLALLGGQRTVATYATRVAIRAACDLLGLRPGDEVLVPAYNCGSEIDPLLKAGLVPVMYDVGADASVDPAEIALRITPRCRAVYLTHYFGVPQPRGAEVRALCDAKGLALMEDCALSLLSQGPAQTGLLGDVAFHCFYKYFPVDAGGAMAINRADLPVPVMKVAPAVKPAVKLAASAILAGLLGQRGIAALKSLRRRLRPGRSQAAHSKVQGLPDMPQDYYFDDSLAGMRMSWLASRPLGGMNVAQAVAARRRNFATYVDLLADLPDARPLFTALGDGVCPLNMPVLVADRDRLARDLNEVGIAALPWWAGYHSGLDFEGFPLSRQLKDHVLALPLHQGLSTEQIAHVVRALAARL